MESFNSLDPGMDLPREFNAVTHFIHRHAGPGGTPDKLAYIDDDGSYTYRQLAERVNRFSNVLRGLGLRQEDRIAMCVLDSIDFPTVFWGAIQAGVIPIATNTLLTPKDYRYQMGDSRAKVLVVEDILFEKYESFLHELPHLEKVLVAGRKIDGTLDLRELIDGASPEFTPAPTTCDDVAFWLYSSGSTGAPKGTQHLHRNLVATAVHYGQNVLGVRADDVVFSAAKLFFAYGLGNGMTFPLHAGATAVLMRERPTPESVMRTLAAHNPTVFYGVPTLFSAILAAPEEVQSRQSKNLRICVSAGEALPEEIGKRWTERYGVEIADGLGSTEMLHIFLSNRPGDVRYGTSGKAVPGYRLQIVDEDGRPVPQGELGELAVAGPSSAIGYWNQREKSVRTFRGAWTFTGDKYYQDEDGYYHYAGRADDMLKVSGNWVAPTEVESALIAHTSVLEAAVIGAEDENGLVKAKAYVVVKDGYTADDALRRELQAFVKARLAPYKYPRTIVFMDTLPKTATGKIQRFKLRAMEQTENA